MHLFLVHFVALFICNDLQSILFSISSLQGVSKQADFPSRCSAIGTAPQSRDMPPKRGMIIFFLCLSDYVLFISLSNWSLQFLYIILLVSNDNNVEVLYFSLQKVQFFTNCLWEWKRSYVSSSEGSVHSWIWRETSNDNTHLFTPEFEETSAMNSYESYSRGIDLYRRVVMGFPIFLIIHASELGLFYFNKI